MIHDLATTFTALQDLPFGAASLSDLGQAGLGTLVAQGASSPFGGMIPLVLIGAVFLFVVILPQRRQEKQRQARLDALKPGDEVVTRGGLLGKVHSTREDGILTLQISDRTRVRVVRSEVTDLYKGTDTSTSTGTGPAKAPPAPSAESKK